MNGRVFLDTNVLVHAYDRSETAKQPQALALLDGVASRGGVVSAQVLGEFFTIVTRKLPSPLTADEAAQRVANFVQSFVVADLTAFTVLEAIRSVREHQMNYWDGLIWASALLNQVPVIFSEDVSSNVVLESVRLVNPFAPDFQLSKWTSS